MANRTKRNRSRFARILHHLRDKDRHNKRTWKWHKQNAPRAFTQLMAARIECHDVFDRLWCGRNAPMSRKLAYSWLQRISGMTPEEAHIAKFDIGLCEAVIEEVKKAYPQLF